MRELVLALITCLALSGCASASGDDEAETLDDILWGRTGTRAENQARLDEQARQREEKIAACMAAEGWEYIPVSHTHRGPLPALPEDPDEFLEKFGYGITTVVELLGDSEPFVDPNEEYVDGLSDADRGAYYDALLGTADLSNSQIDEETDEVWFDLVGGCQNEAANQDGVQAVWDELGPALDELHQRVESDPRIVDAMTRWSGCMAEAGYTFARLSEPFEYLIEKQNDLWSSHADPFEGMTEQEVREFMETASEEERQAADSGPDEAAIEAAVAELRAEEMAIATLDRECRRKHIGDIEDEVRRDLEAQFIAENRELLQNARDAFGGG